MLRPSVRFYIALVACGISACSRAPHADSVALSSAAAPPSTQVAPSAASSSHVAGALPGHHHGVAAAELVHFAATRGTLGGFLYAPKGPGPFPAIVFNHGSEPKPGSFYGQALFYVQHGYVLFVPHRLGQGESPGTYVLDLVAAAPSDERRERLVSVLEDQVTDVADAVMYLQGLSMVDRHAVAIVGCSFGGIETILAAQRDLGLRAAVDFSGGAQTWASNLGLRDAMTSAARAARIPVFFLQAENDYDTQPSLVLSRAMNDAGKPNQVRIYPPVGTTAEDGHGFCRGGVEPAWGEDVLAFLAKNGM